MFRRFPRPHRPPRPEHRVNRAIRFPEIKVVSDDGESLGVMSPERGRQLARDAELDLVEIAPNERPPVCKLMDYGRFKYERSKRSSQKGSSSVKTIQLRPKTTSHDLATKLGHARRFLERGDKVKVVMRLRGREQAFVDRSKELLLRRVRDGLEGAGRVACQPAHQGRQISLLVEPARA